MSDHDHDADATGTARADQASDLPAQDLPGDDLPGEEDLDTSNVSTVISVRLRDDELATIESAATANGLRLGTYIRQAALQAAIDGKQPVDKRDMEKAAARVNKEVSRLLELAGATSSTHGGAAKAHGRPRRNRELRAQREARREQREHRRARRRTRPEASDSDEG